MDLRLKKQFREEQAFEKWMKLNKVKKTENSKLYLYDDGLLTIQMIRTVYNTIKLNQ